MNWIGERFINACLAPISLGDLEVGGIFSGMTDPPQQDLNYTDSVTGAPCSPTSRPRDFVCGRCGKSFSREDLLRRHQIREARALAAPAIDRQKSCYACARSKARCDLGVPSCERCRKRNIQCVRACLTLRYMHRTPETPMYAKRVSVVSSLRRQAVYHKMCGQLLMETPTRRRPLVDATVEPCLGARHSQISRSARNL